MEEDDGQAQIAVTRKKKKNDRRDGKDGKDGKGKRRKKGGKEVKETEMVQVEKGLIEEDEDEDLEPLEVGIALSGGGIRSAAFSSGVLSAISSNLKDSQKAYISDVSCVSGGGFTGSSYAIMFHKMREKKMEEMERKRDEAAKIKKKKNRKKKEKEEEWDVKARNRLADQAAQKLHEKMRNNVGYLVSWDHPSGSVWKGVLSGIGDVLTMVGALFVLFLLFTITFIPLSFPTALIIEILFGDILLDLPTAAISPLTLVAIFAVMLMFILPVIRTLFRLCGLHLPKRMTDISLLYLGVWLVIIVGVLLTDWITTSESVKRLQDVKIDEVSDDLLLIFLTAFAAFLRLLPQSAFSTKMRHQIATPGLFSMFWGNVAYWRIFGNYQQFLPEESRRRITFMFLPYSETTWNVLFIITVSLLLFHWVLADWKDKFLHAFYRWRLARAFYEGGPKLEGFLNRGISFQDFDQNDDVHYISNATSNLWKTSRYQPPDWRSDLKHDRPDLGLIEVGPKGNWRIGGQDEILQGDPAAFASTSLSKMMSISGAAASSTMGTFQVGKKFGLSMLGITLGRWKAMRGRTRSIQFLGFFVNFLSFGPLLVFGSDIITEWLSTWFGLSDSENESLFNTLFVIWMIVTMIIWIVIVPVSSKNWKWTALFRALPLSRIFIHLLGFPSVNPNFPTYVYLSDGGHYENLGILPLLRARKKVIFVSDAGADPQYMYTSFFRALDLAREYLHCSFSPLCECSDLNKEVIDDVILNPSKSSLSFTINYHDSNTGEVVERGKMTYIKARRKIEFHKGDGEETDLDGDEPVDGICCNCCHRR